VRVLLALCVNELRLLLRDLHGLLVLFVVPAAFILIMSLALRDAFDPRSLSRQSLVVDNRDGGELSRRLLHQLRESGSFELADGDAPLRLTVLPGFSELLAGRAELADDYLAGEVEPTLLRLDYAPSLMPQARAAAGMALRQALLAVQSDYLLTTQLDLPPERLPALRYLGDPRHLPLAEEFAGRDGRTLSAPTAVQQNVPAWLIFAIFFSVIPLATSFVVEREQGSLLRLRALDVPAWTVFAAKAVPYYAVNLLQLAVMFAIGRWLVPALGGDRFTPGDSVFGLWLIASGTSAAAIGLALLVAVQMRTTTQATIAGGAISLILAALGGIMVPKLVMPPAMQQLTLLSPMSWSLEGFWTLCLHHGGWRDVLAPAGGLLLFGLLALLLATWRFRRLHQGASS
jgi:ABC-2 type transport system permease protein